MMAQDTICLNGYELSCYLKMFHRLKKADIEQYQAWLQLYYGRGGPSDSIVCDSGSFKQTAWFVASDSLSVYPLFGGLRLNIIVLDPAKLTIIKRGDNRLFFPNGYASPGAKPPLYKKDANLAKQ